MPGLRGSGWFPVGLTGFKLDGGRPASSPVGSTPSHSRHTGPKTKHPTAMNVYSSRQRRRPAFGFAGVLIVVGLVVLLNNLGFLNLGYAFGVLWPGVLILIGLGMLRGQPKAIGLFLVLLGGIFLAENVGVLPESWDLGRLWPVFLVGFGVWLLLRNRLSSEIRIGSGRR